MKPKTWGKIITMLGRTVGIAFVVGGAVVGSWGFSVTEWIAASAGSIIVICGVLLIVARPYQPDEKKA